jgi:hypothetical protein
MGFEKRDYSLASVQGLSIPVIQSPAFQTCAQKSFTTPVAFTWEYTIPPNDQVWSIVNFSAYSSFIISLPFTIELNGTAIWSEINNYSVRWTPGVPSSFKVAYPDKLEITLLYMYAEPHSVYWEMDFWKEPVF